jgi:two-component system LytT family response regulator
MEFIEAICSDENISVIPLIVIDRKNSFEVQRSAMESGADDYIPEEFLEGSLINSVKQRMKKLSLIRQAVNNTINSFDEPGEKTKANDHILVKIGNKLKLVEFSEIVCITALKEYSRLITRNNYKIVVRKSLKHWVEILPKTFLRIHRGTIININYIEEITKTNERTYTVHLKHINKTFDFSHRYANIMRRTFPT